MPQLDMFNWIHQVVTTTFLLLIFFFACSVIYLPMMNGLIKSRTKIQNARVLCNTILNFQFMKLIQTVIQDLQSTVTNSVMIVWLFNIYSNEMIIKTWLLEKTPFWVDLCTLLVQKEQTALSAELQTDSVDN